MLLQTFPARGEQRAMTFKGDGNCEVWDRTLSADSYPRIANNFVIISGDIS